MRAAAALGVALAGLLAGCSSILLEAANGADRIGTHYRREADVAYGSDARQRLGDVGGLGQQLDAITPRDV